MIARQQIRIASTRLGVRLCTCIVVATFCSQVFAQDKQTGEGKIGVLSNVGDIVDSTHGRFSEGFSNFVIQIDDFFGSGVASEERNKSWARIRLDAIKPGAEKAKISGTVKLRIVLPRAQQRFRLLLSNEDEVASASNSDAAQREQIAADDNKDVSLALRFIRSARRAGSINYDLGARVRDDKGQVFVRMNAAYTRDLFLGFENIVSNNLVFYSSSGYENKFRFDIRRPLFNSESVFVRSSTEVVWRKGLKGAGIGEVLGAYANLSKRKAIAFESISGFTTSLNDGLTKQYRGTELRIRFRHNIWRKWFFYEIWPSVSWSASNDYDQAYGGLLRMEVVLGQL